MYTHTQTHTHIHIIIFTYISVRTLTPVRTLNSFRFLVKQMLLLVASCSLFLFTGYSFRQKLVY